MRNFLYRINQRRKKIKKRMKIADLWRFNFWGYREENQYKGQEGRLSKYNLNCGCKMCKHYKHIGNSKDRLSHRDKKMLSK